MKKIKCAFPDAKCHLLRKIDKNPICAATIGKTGSCKPELEKEIKGLEDKIAHLKNETEIIQKKYDENPTDELKDNLDKLKDMIETADFDKGCVEDRIENGDYKGCNESDNDKDDDEEEEE